MAVEKGVGFPITAVDQFSGAFDQLKAKIAGVEGVALRLSGVMATITGGGMVAMITEMVRAHDEATQAQQKLEAVLRATGNTTGFTSQKLNVLADVLARTSRFDDEAFRNATATLVRFGNIGGQNLERVLKLSADYAAVTGGELSAAAETLGRALNSPAEGVARLERGFGDLGRETVEAIKLQEEMGNRSGALAIAIEALEKKIGGSDQAMNQGLTGSMRGLRKAISELMEAGGSAVDNSVTVGILDAISARLRGIKTVLEGDWTLKLAAIMGLVGGRGFETLGAIGNLAQETPKPGAAGSLPFDLGDQDKRGEAYLRKVVEQRKKAAEEILAYNERMRELNLRGEYAALQAEHDALEEGQRRKAALGLEGIKYDEWLRNMEQEGQIGLSQAVVRIVQDEERKVAEIRKANSFALWDEVSSAAGSFFSDLVMNGKSAFDNLRKWAKQLMADMLALFAKRWVLNVAAGGSLLGSAGSALAGDGGGGLAGSLLGGLTGSPIGAVVGGLGIAAALYGLFKDKGENPNFRWMQGTGGAGAFGGISSSGNYSFDASGLTGYIGGLDRRFANILGSDGSARATSALAGYTQTGLRMDGQPAQFAFPEGTDAEAAEQLAKELLQSRYGVLFGEIDAELADQVKNFSGTSSELQVFIETMLGVVEGLSGIGIKGLDIDALQAMQKEGEDLGDTFTRVANQWAWFTDNFYTDAEKLELAQKQVDDTFEALGIAVPKNVTEFRKLVESLDLSTEAGRQFYEMLMGVAPAFLQVAGAADDLGDSSTGAADEVVKSVKRIVTSTAELREEARRAAETLKDAKLGLQDYLGGLLLNDNLSPLTMQQQLEEAKSQFEKTLGLAKGDDLDAVNGLGGSFDAYLALARQIYGSSSEYNAIFQTGFDAIKGVAGGGPSWQSAMQSALPPAGTTMASSADIADLKAEVTKLLSEISQSSKRSAGYSEKTVTELRSGRKGALSS